METINLPRGWRRNLTLPLELVPFPDARGFDHITSPVILLPSSLPPPPTPSRNLNHKLPRNKGFAETPVGFCDVRASGAFTPPPPSLSLSFHCSPKCRSSLRFFANFLSNFSTLSLFSCKLYLWNILERLNIFETVVLQHENFREGL